MKHTACTSQSPAVKETLVILAGVFVVRETPDAVAVINSPTLPAFALSASVVPTIPAVVEGVNVPMLLNVVKAPVLAAVLPIAGGLARVLATNAVVANWVVFVPFAAVGAVGVPVNVG